MQTLDNIYTFNTRNFEVRVDAMEENFPDLSFDETGETAEMIERGDWLCFAVRASVSCNGMEIAEDYLGNCIYENTRDFRDHFGMRRNSHGSYFSDMIRGVVSEARKQINSLPKIKHITK
jgi:hypothetical protein